MTALIPFAHVPESERPKLGGKGSSLARMAAEGLPVPAGACIPGSALARVLEEGGWMGLAREVHRKVDPEAAARIAEGLMTAPIPSGWVAQWQAAARSMGGRVAVRSSGVDEDGAQRSFAGQHATVLGVSEAGVEAAVRSVWASAWSAPALAYRRGQGPAPDGMAVVLMAMVEPQVSGVMFTVNPLNGSWREMVIESVWGLGEGLVSGQVVPHWTLVRRPRGGPRPVRKVLERVRLQVVQQDLPILEEQWVNRGDEIVREAVPKALRHRATLDQGTALRLARLGLEVEALFGEPVDVEFAIGADGKLALLQARPITTTGTPRTRTDVLWTRRFIGERWQEPATPFGWSVMEPLINWFIAYPKTQARFLGGGPALKLVRSRPYLNATVFRHLAFKFPGSPPPSFMMELVPPEEEREWRKRFAVAADFAVYASIFRETFEEKRWERFRWNPFTNHEEWARFEPQLEAALPQLRRRAASPADAVRLFAEQREWLRDYVTIHVTSLLFANLWYQVLEGMLASWMEGEGARWIEGLSSGAEGNRTLAMNQALWALAHGASDADLGALAAGQPLSGDFGRGIEAFLRDFGHRADASWEIFSRRFRDDPRALAPLLSAQRSAPGASPEQRAQASIAARRSAEEAVKARLGVSWRAAILLRVGALTRAYVLLRENQRFWFDHLLGAMQENLLGLGQALVGQGLLAEPGDIAFLTIEEVQALVEGGLSGEDAREFVSRRRKQRDDDAKVQPPVFLVGDEGLPEGITHGKAVGLGVSPGRHRGLARVLHHPSEAHKLRPGEILVARAVDPAWTPLFATAGGLVLELGSALSHGAVVAREYKLPAVVNIAGATRRFTDGMEITVDGTRGIVVVHP